MLSFESVEEAWFWFIITSRLSAMARDLCLVPAMYQDHAILWIFKILDVFYRKRGILRDHLLIMRHYERWNMLADSHRAKEAHAARLCDEVLNNLASSYGDLIALPQIMKGDEPSLNKRSGNLFEGAKDEDFQFMMRNLKYWREKDQAFVEKVTQGFQTLYRSFHKAYELQFAKR